MSGEFKSQKLCAVLLQIIGLTGSFDYVSKTVLVFSDHCLHSVKQEVDLN